MSQLTASVDEAAIRSIIERWAVLRDGGMWAEFAELWCADGQMSATWFEGSATDFIQASRAGYERGVNVTHFLGGAAIEVVGDRAVAQTKMSITQRVELHGVLVDIECTGRFYDLLRREEGRFGWGIRDRRVIYENDRIVAVVPGAPLRLDESLLAQFPEGYRHLGYAQALGGLSVRPGLPGRSGPALEALMAEGRAWLGGAHD
ncbi:nuclear transport factor 2 family protein [Subtercola lobariae]|uniref:SnoaL-like domain-containing protein n=1 Tax=Subtercola lobariae TaxID=1588641 RepID=A0A917EWK6_9MICO|nr:nuclear transport factor 2 family protein [Subtercola lobariae]GGF15691.1 hypothetical protein GCM10011399_06910 [Subtercola lobariae]